MTEPADPADAVARAAREVGCVAALAGGVATFLPGRRVDGVRLTEEAVEVAVVLRLDGRPLPVLADEVRSAVAPHAAGRRVDVTVADVLEPAEGPADAPADGHEDTSANASGRSAAREPSSA